MAFVCRSERTLQAHETVSLGPGAYLPQDKYKLTQLKVPFLSSSNREITKPLPNYSTPGPGTYSDPQGTNELDGWGQPKFSSPFASQNSRFKEKKSSLSPGPGAYNIDKYWKNSQKMNKGNSGFHKKLSIESHQLIPSIPPVHQFQGYEIDKNGKMSMVQQKIKGHSGEKFDSAGPGEYNIERNLKNRGTNFHKSSKDRDYNKYAQTTGQFIGPGSYLVDNIKPEEIYKYRNSSVFADKSKKGLDFNSIVPGPGAYDCKFSAFNNKKKNKKLQNFGSNSQRFQLKLNWNELGPGCYEITEDFNSLSPAKVPFISPTPRFKEKEDLSPGPGFYESEGSSVKNKAVKAAGTFGSTEKRFVDKINENSPGPGYYKIGKKGKRSSPNAVFISNTARTEIINKGDAPPPGYYDIKLEIGNEKLPVLNIVKNVKSTQNMKYAFSGSTHRFDLSGKETETPGPGTYDWKVKKKLGKVIVSDQDRFKNKSKFNDQEFYVEDGKWYKKSYNVHF